MDRKLSLLCTYQLFGWLQAARVKPEHCPLELDGAMLAVVQTGAWHWAFLGSLEVEREHNWSN